MPRDRLTAAAGLFGAVVAGGAWAETLMRDGDGFVLGELRLSTPYAQRELVAEDGPGDAVRFDGNSNWLEADGDVTLETSDGLAAGAWLALASPPGDTAAIVYLAEGGLLLGLNRWRQPEIRLGDLRAAASDPLPVSEWVHVAGDYDGETLRLRVDGEVVAEAEGEGPGEIEGLFAIGRALDAGFQQDTHPLGAVNGILGAVTFRRDADPVEPGPSPETAPDLDAPGVWFADDPDRPVSLPLGATGWTNEPHALTHRDGLWHLYFQANPNGAFWRDIVWGHQVSSDLGRWERRRPALMPTTGFDQRGVWVGNWIPGREPPAVLYTGVDGHSAGIGLAEARPDGSLDLVRVVAEDTPHEYQDMRDPWVIRTDDGWLMLIGAGARDRDEAIVYSYTSDDGTEWTPAVEFDTGGVEMPGQYWELPVLIEIGDRWMLMGTPVVAKTPARTLYWLGEFDGERFIPDDPAPRQLDILATYRAPTLAEGPDGEVVAVGIVADEIRGEEERHESGWVHVLTPATVLEPCPDAPQDLCHSLAPAFVETFGRTLVDAAAGRELETETAGRPTLLRATIDAAEGGVTTLFARSTGDGGASAILTIDAATGVVRLDYTRGPVLPLGRPAVIEGSIPPFASLDIEILIDGAAIFGALNGRPVAFLAFATAPGRDGLRLAGEDGSEIEEIEILWREIDRP
jgi:hypothetical protein